MQASSRTHIATELDSSLWSSNFWTYAGNFIIASARNVLAGNPTQVLVCDEMKMGATVLVSGKVVGTMADQLTLCLLVGEMPNRIEVALLGIDNILQRRIASWAARGTS